ncbi:MAG: nitroreductase family protein, partial [Deltaproteobacteria bacterium]|nr:nitroreductase family protein [Deltaproteobacteria bacterium]
IPGLNPDEYEPAPSKSEIPAPEPLLAFFRSRRSTRRYKKDSVERAKLEKIIEAGRFAPTGGNRQPLIQHPGQNLPESQLPLEVGTKGFLDSNLFSHLVHCPDRTD